MNRKIWILPYKGQILGETRQLYYLKAFGHRAVKARIVSFGLCNLKCPYCKRRNGEFNTVLSGATLTDLDTIKIIIDSAVKNREIIRFSGGDPSLYPEVLVELLSYVKNIGGQTSIAHNGSNPTLIKKILKLLDSASIDIKETPLNYGKVTGLPADVGSNVFWQAVECQDLIASKGIPVDIRTPVFSDTALEDLLIIGEQINRKNAEMKFWTLRVFSSVPGCSLKAADIDRLLLYAGQLRKTFHRLRGIGVRSKWHGGFIYL